MTNSIPQDQTSDEWKTWRQWHIGASELSIILGKSKWMTAYELWRQKLGFSDGIKDNWAMKRGRDLEPIVRELVNVQLDSNYQPIVMVHPELEWASASLDGYDKEEGMILEIKVPGLADHKEAEDGRVPEHYFSQMQWQFFVSETEKGVYASYYNDQLEIVAVERDDDYIKDVLLPAASDFYRCMIDMIEPETVEKDFIQITDDKFPEIAREWKAANEMFLFYQDKERFYKKKLIEFTDDSNCHGCGVKIQRVKRDGSIDWKDVWSKACEKMPGLSESIDPENFRKEQIGYWKISKEKQE